jgi:hypothetical protein
MVQGHHRTYQAALPHDQGSNDPEQMHEIERNYVNLTFGLGWHFQ